MHALDGPAAGQLFRRDCVTFRFSGVAGSVVRFLAAASTGDARCHRPALTGIVAVTVAVGLVPMGLRPPEMYRGRPLLTLANGTVILIGRSLPLGQLGLRLAAPPDRPALGCALQQDVTGCNSGGAAVELWPGMETKPKRDPPRRRLAGALRQIARLAAGSGAASSEPSTTRPSPPPDP